MKKQEHFQLTEETQFSQIYTVVQNFGFGENHSKKMVWTKNEKTRDFCRIHKTLTLKS